MTSQICLMASAIGGTRALNLTLAVSMSNVLQVSKDEDGASIKHLREVVRMLGLDVASNQT